MAGSRASAALAAAVAGGMALSLLAAGSPPGGQAALGHAGFLPTPQRPVGWRGDGRGVFPGATPPTTWDGPSGKNILWSVEMPHQTHASPIGLGEMTAAPFFHGDRIYVRTYTHLFCIGAKP